MRARTCMRAHERVTASRPGGKTRRLVAAGWALAFAAAEAAAAAHAHAVAFATLAETVVAHPREARPGSRPSVISDYTGPCAACRGLLSQCMWYGSDCKHPAPLLP